MKYLQKWYFQPWTTQMNVCMAVTQYFSAQKCLANFSRYTFTHYSKTCKKTHLFGSLVKFLVHMNICCLCVWACDDISHRRAHMRQRFQYNNSFITIILHNLIHKHVFNITSAMCVSVCVSSENMHSRGCLCWNECDTEHNMNRTVASSICKTVPHMNSSASYWIK